MWKDLPVVYFGYYHIHFFSPSHLVEGRSRVVGDKEKHRDGYASKLFKDMLWHFCIYLIYYRVSVPL